MVVHMDWSAMLLGLAVGMPVSVLFFVGLAWGMRLAGLALLLTSAWGLWMGLMHDQAPWCGVPAA